MMMRIVVPVILASCICIASVRSQAIQLGTWKSYTNMQDIRDGEMLESSVLAATAGGLFSYAKDTQTFTLTTNADGLSTNDLTAVGTDGLMRIWVGGAQGEVHVIDPLSGEMIDILNIAQSPRLQKAIRRFIDHGDTVFIVSEFGVSVFRTDKWEFGDTYANFTIPAGPNVRDAVVFNDSLWIASATGLLVGWLGSTNLSAPSSWNVVGAGSLPSTNIYGLTVLRDTLIVATGGGLAVNGGNGLQIVPAQLGRPIQRLEKAGSDLVLMSVQSGQTTLIKMFGAFDGGVQMSPLYPGPANDVVIDAGDGTSWLMTTADGMLEETAGQWVVENPDAPGISVFYHIAVDEKGVLWAGSGINAGGRGFTRFSSNALGGDQWRTFTVGDHPVLSSDDYYRVNPVGSGSVWVSSWGYGTVEVRQDSIIRKIDTQTSPAVASSVPGSPSFAVVGSVVKDGTGTIWMVNRTAVNGNVLAKLLPDGTMQYEKNLLPGGEGRFTSMVIDRNGTKWLANSEPTAKASTGLYYFNEDLIVDGTSSTGGWGQLSTNDGLPNNSVISLAVDHDDDIWVGTDLGVSIITNPRSPRSRRSSSFPLREQSIQSIAVDATNRKWVGTKEGVFVISSDGSRLLEQYTVSNTNGALIDDDVRSIAIDQQRGIVYMGTERGLSALWIAAVETKRSFSTLDIGPNPYVIPTSDQLSIRNLVENSSIKILTIDGRMIVEFSAQGGGRAFWDGKDTNGAYVASGVYLVVAYAENGEQVTRGKVVVIRR